MTDSSTPAGSSRPGRGSRESGTRISIATSESTTIGALIMKTEPHQKWSSSRPPAIGPTAMATPTPPAQIPIALGCSSRSKTFIKMARLEGITKAPPTPISARKVISSAGEPDTPASTDPAPNTARPKSSIFLRPRRSPSSPAVNSSPAKTRV